MPHKLPIARKMGIRPIGPQDPDGRGAPMGLIPISLALAVLALSGCGYRTGPLVTNDVATVHIAMFDNITFRRGLEVQLTDAVRMEVTRRTRLRLVARSQADSVLTGTIVDVREHALSHDPQGVVLIKELTVYADFEWRDARTGRDLARGVRVSRPPRPATTQPADLAAATSRSLADVAKAIVDVMEGGW